MTKSISSNTMQMCTFRMAGRLFGVNILDVKEVNENLDVTPIHHAPSIVCGYMNIRGQILLVVDLCEAFGFERGNVQSHSKAVVFKQHVDEPFGILVDSVGDVISVKAEHIVDRRAHENGLIPEQTREMRKARNNLVVGVCPLDSEIMLVLNANCILGVDNVKIENANPKDK